MQFIYRCAILVDFKLHEREQERERERERNRGKDREIEWEERDEFIKKKVAVVILISNQSTCI